MPDWRSHQPVNLRVLVDRAEPIAFQQRRGIHLAEIGERSCIGPGRSESPREDARCQAGLAHADQNQPATAARLSAEVEKRYAVGETVHRRRDLDHLRAGRSHGLRAVVQIGRRSRKVVRRHDDAPAAGLLDEILEMRAPLDIHVLGAEGQRVGEYPAPLLFGTSEPAPFPFRPARHERRAPAPESLAA